MPSDIGIIYSLKKITETLFLIRNKAYVAVVDLSKSRCYKLFESIFDIDQSRNYTFEAGLKDQQTVEIIALEYNSKIKNTYLCRIEFTLAKLYELIKTYDAKF